MSAPPRPTAEVEDETGAGPRTLVVGCVLFAAAVVIPLFRQAGRHSWDRIFSEDGFIYTQQAMRNGALTSLFRGYAGYLQLPPRILGALASFVPVRDLAVFLAVAGTVTLALLGLFVYHVTSTWIESVPLRLAVGGHRRGRARSRVREHRQHHQHHLGDGGGGSVGARLTRGAASRYRPSCGGGVPGRNLHPALPRVRAGGHRVGTRPQDPLVRGGVRHLLCGPGGAGPGRPARGGHRREGRAQQRGHARGRVQRPGARLLRRRPEAHRLVGAPARRALRPRARRGGGGRVRLSVPRLHRDPLARPGRRVRGRGHPHLRHAHLGARERSTSIPSASRSSSSRATGTAWCRCSCS